MNALKRSISEFIGLFEGKVWMSDDFDEPLEEMREYMEFILKLSPKMRAKTLRVIDMLSI